MIKRHNITSIRFQDINGVKREIQGLPLSKRRRFKDLYAFLFDLLAEYPGVSLERLYDAFDGNTDFQEVTDEILSLFGISPDWISLKMLHQFLFEYEGGKGLLIQLEFPEQAKQGKPLPEGVDPDMAAIASLWSFTPEKTIDEVSQSAESMPFNELQQVLEERVRQMEEANPELKKKREQERQKEEMKAEFAKAMKDGTLFQDAPINFREALAGVGNG